MKLAVRYDAGRGTGEPATTKINQAERIESINHRIKRLSQLIEQKNQAKADAAQKERANAALLGGTPRIWASLKKRGNLYRQFCQNPVLVGPRQTLKWLLWIVDRLEAAKWAKRIRTEVCDHG